MQCAAGRGYQMKAIRTTPAKARNTGIRLCRVSGMLAHAGCEYEGKAYIETMADLSKQRSLCTVHAELAEDPGEDSADDTAEDPDDSTPDIDGLPGDLINSLPEDDIAEEV
jgi:hypothetical protein